MKRQRAMSEAVDDISVSAVNSLVQSLIEKEFQVFPHLDRSGKDKEKGKKTDKSLEQSLKILKVLNFVCKHTNLLSSQGMKFLINTAPNEAGVEEDQGFTDFDL